MIFVYMEIFPGFDMLEKKGFLRDLCRNLLALFPDKNERYISGLKLKISVSLKLNTNK